MLSAQDQSRLQSSGAVPMKRLFDRLGTIWLRLFQLNAWERPRRSLRPFCSYLATTQASRLEPNCKWTAEALILTCLKVINMNGEKDKLIRDFMNAFEKKDVKVLEEFFHPNVVFRNYGDKEVRGREELLKVWSHVFGMFGRVRFETFNQATNENIVIPHGRSGGRPVPVQGGNGPEQHTNHLGFRHFARG